MRTYLAVIATCLLASGLAAAQPPRYRRAQHLDLRVNLSERAKPVERTTESRAPAKPTITADALLAIEARTQPIKRQQETILLRLIRDTPDTDPEKPEYLFRLAEHYARQLRFYRLRSIESTMPRRERARRR